MRFMVIVKASERSESGQMPSSEVLARMGAFNEELVKAGILLAGEGLQPSSKGARISFAGSKPVVTDGPFAETKELVGICDRVLVMREGRVAAEVPAPDLSEERLVREALGLAQ